MRSVRKSPLAALLVERGIFESADEALRWVMAGQVLVNDQRIDKPGLLVPCDATLRVRGRQRYASRGGYKLEAALEHFAVNVAGCVALDSGASTGGFTDCLLQHGAALVYAVEVGYGQLVGRLRADPRVCNLERTNLSDLISTPTRGLLKDASQARLPRAPQATLRGATPQPSLITLDLSYLSLTKALPIAAALLATEGQVLALLKPLFEVESAEARRSGQVDDPALLVAALRSVLGAGATAGLLPLGAAKLALQPRRGVTEFFVFFGRNANLTPLQYDDTILTGIVEGPGIGDTEED